MMRIRVRHRSLFLAVFVALLLSVSSVLAGATAELERAEKLYTLTEYEASLKILKAIPQKDGAVYLLMGKNYYGNGDFKKATETLEKAVAAEPGNSEYYHWLGRAYGRRAETSSLFTAPVFASRTRDNFEKAVQLNPKNIEAINDLFEYYLEAPGFLGGGLEKAANLSRQIAALDPVEGHYAQARLAEKQKEFGDAEAQLRRAVALAPNKVGRVIDLATFLAKQGKYQESEEAFQRAAKIAPNNPKVMFARAETYVQNGRNLETARKLLKQYLQAQLTPEDPPRSKAEELLKQAGS